MKRKKRDQDTPSIVSIVYLAVVASTVVTLYIWMVAGSRTLREAVGSAAVGFIGALLLAQATTRTVKRARGLNGQREREQARRAAVAEMLGRGERYR